MKSDATRSAALHRTGLETLIARGTLSGPLVGLYGFWDQSRRSSPMPSYQELMTEGLIRWWGHLCVSERDFLSDRFRVSWVGGDLFQVYEHDLTGRFLDEVLPRLGLKWLLESYEHCVRTGRPSYTLSPGPMVEDGTARDGRPDASGSGASRSLARLLLPCGRNGRVEAILAASYSVAR
ncbi:hypothetical protein [Azospirillum sp. SYSU D00513]|uniref:hypothetical protein n=1 Tax=Azospirillum sp. SYSU D00513 TaxID=2812561 RepID=UPI001A964448|nr:hypothetical protein [Azospirillum sp. SYSU D00513]